MVPPSNAQRKEWVRIRHDQARAPNNSLGAMERLNKILLRCCPVEMEWARACARARGKVRGTVTVSPQPQQNRAPDNLMTVLVRWPARETAHRSGIRLRLRRRCF